jgi:hypothetical protein
MIIRESKALKKGLLYMSNPYVASDDNWLRGLDLNQRPSGYEANFQQHSSLQKQTNPIQVMGNLPT